MLNIMIKRTNWLSSLDGRAAKTPNGFIVSGCGYLQGVGSIPSLATKSPNLAESSNVEDFAGAS